MSEPVIEVKSVSKVYKLYSRNRDRLKDSFGIGKVKHYKEHHALKDLSFSVQQGECVGIIGTNGAGKSTILKIITGVLTPTSGELKIKGRISALLELGAGFNMEYSGIENIYLNGTMMGFSRAEIDERMDDILKFADIGEFVHQPVKTYSSGMFVRLAFAVAINIDPEILIVDEALSVGDVFFQAKCFHKFEEFKKQGKTILFVSHDLSSIQRYCDKVILLNKGEKLGEGTPAQMIDLYKRALVGQIDEMTQERVDGSWDEKQKLAEADRWKTAFERNPSYQEYGDKKVEIIDYAFVDDTGKYTSTIIKNHPFLIKVKIHAWEDVEDPIVAYTFKDLKGLDITGTNTLFENTPIGPLKAGEERVITFRQEMNLQGMQYLMSFGCTRYEKDDFKVYHRLYDIMSISVVSDKNTVGFYDMNSTITIEKE